MSEPYQRPGNGFAHQCLKHATDSTNLLWGDSLPEYEKAPYSYRLAPERRASIVKASPMPVPG